MVLALELGFISENDVAGYYGDFDSYLSVASKLPSFEEIEEYADNEYRKATSKLLSYLLVDEKIPVSKSSEIVRLLGKSNPQYIREGIQLFLKEELQDLQEANPILANIEKVDELVDKRAAVIERGMLLGNKDIYLGLFDTEEVNKKLDDNFDVKKSVFDTTIKKIDPTSRKDVNEYKINDENTAIDIQEAKNNLSAILGDSVELRTDFETVLDNMKTTGEV
jgi:hypothetical protein